MHFSLDRRQFLRLTAGSGLALSAPRLARPESGMATRPIPATGEQLPVIGLGTADEFDYLPDPAEAAELRSVLTTLLDAGGSLVDTSPSYGHSERVLGDLMKDRQLQERLFLATKISLDGRQARRQGIEQMQRSHELMGKSPLDLLQVHNLNDLGTQWHNLLDWKAAGRVRYIGVTVYRYGHFARLEQFMRRTPGIDFVQLNYSPMEPRADEVLIPLAADKGIAVLANVPFGNGRYFSRVGNRQLPDWSAEFDCESWAQFSLKWILGNRDVTCVIPATSDPGHMLDNARAGMGALPDAGQRRRIVEYLQSM